MNSVRKHVSAVKGGRLAAAAPAAMKISLGVTDVPDGASQRWLRADAARSYYGVGCLLCRREVRIAREATCADSRAV